MYQYPFQRGDMWQSQPNYIGLLYWSATYTTLTAGHCNQI